MGIHVVDGLVRLAGVADHLAVEVDLRPSPHGAVAGREPVVPEVSGQPDPDDVGEEAQLDGVASRDAVGVGDQAVAEALRVVLPVGLRAVDGVAQTVVERPDPRAVHRALHGRRETRAVGRRPERPPLPVQVHALAVHAVLFHGQAVQRSADPLHGLDRGELHEVESEAVDLVGPGPREQGVDHEVLGHDMLGGELAAAGAGQRLAFVSETVVVAGHDLLEDGLCILAVGVGVVEDDVLDDLVSGLVEVAHHLAVFGRAGPAVRLDGVRSLRGRVVEGVVPPVEGVHVRDLADGGLLFLRVGRRIGRHGRLPLLGRVLGHRAHVVGGQKVHCVHPRRREFAQVGHPGRALDAEGPVLAPQPPGDGRVRGGEVAHVQLHDGALGEASDPRSGGVRPHLGHVALVGQIEDDRSLGVDGQPHRVRVGDEIVLDGSRDPPLGFVSGGDGGDGDVDLDVVQVGLVLPGRPAGEGPRAVRFAPHRMLGVPLRDGAPVQAERDGLGGGRPQRERGDAVGEGHALGPQARRFGVHRVEDPRRLERGEGDGPAVGATLEDDDLPRQEGCGVHGFGEAQCSEVFAVERVGARQVGVEGLLPGGDPAVLDQQLDRAVRSRDPLPVEFDPPSGRVVQPVRRPLARRPGDRVLVEPEPDGLAFSDNRHPLLHLHRRNV